MDSRNRTAPEARQHQGGNNQGSMQGELSLVVRTQGNPDYPDPRTVFGRVLGAHLSGHRLTVADSLRRFGHDRLPDSEFKLRRLGWPIKSIRKSVKTTDGGREANVAEYFLDIDAITAAGDRGQRYAAECDRVNAERRAA